MINNVPEQVAIFCIDAAVKGPVAATQAYLGSKAIDACTDYSLAVLDRRREASYYKDKQVKIIIVSDFEEEAKISPVPFTQTSSGCLKIKLEDEYVFEAEKEILPVERPTPLVKFSKHKEVISSGVKIGVGVCMGGVLPTMGSVALSVAAGATVRFAGSFFQAKEADSR